jgi:hypothetical protein
MDGEQCVPPVVLLEEEALQLRLIEAFGKSGQGTSHFFAHIFPFRGELRQDLDFFLFFFQPGEGRDLAFEFLALLLEGLKLFLVLPGLRRRQFGGDSVELGPFFF